MRLKLALGVLFLIGIALTFKNPQARLWLVYFQEAVINTIHPYSPRVPPATFKPLLSEGDIVEAKTKSGEIRIEALDSHTRKYEWRTSPKDKWNTEIVTVFPNDSHGTLYNPGNTSENIFTFLRLKKNVMVWEGEANYRDEQKLTIELKNYAVSHSAVYSKTGLLVGVSLQRPDFLILQLKVNGKIPNNLEGADDNVTRTNAH